MKYLVKFQHFRKSKDINTKLHGYVKSKFVMKIYCEYHRVFSTEKVCDFMILKFSVAFEYWRKFLIGYWSDFFVETLFQLKVFSRI